MDYRECYATEWISPNGLPRLWISLKMCVCVSVCVFVRVLAGGETGPYEALAPKREGETEKAQLFITPAGQQPVTTAVTTPKTGTHT